MGKNFKLNIAESVKRTITLGVYNAVKYDMPELIGDNRLPTGLGSGFFRWNFIYRNVIESLDGVFEIVLWPRGAWKVLLLHDIKTGLIFSFMAERNFSNMQKHLPEKIYYLESLIAKNRGYTPIEGQMEIALSYERPIRDPSQIENLREQMLSGFTGILSNHVLILFDYNSFLEGFKIRAVLVTPELEIAFSESWSAFAEFSYFTDSEKLHVERTDSIDNQLVKLKDGVKSSVALNLTKINDDKVNKKR